MRWPDEDEPHPRLNVALFNECRLRAELTVREVADRSGIAYSTLYRHTSGKSTHPTREFVHKLLKLFPFPALFVPVDDDIDDTAQTDAEQVSA